MPDRAITLIEQWAHGLGFFLTGSLISLGQILAGPDRLSFRLVIGRALSVGGLAMSAGGVLMLYPDLPYLGQLGVSAALASLGASGLERLFQRVLERKA